VDALHSSAIVIRINRRAPGRNSSDELERAFGYMDRALTTALALDHKSRVAEIEHTWGIWLYTGGDFAGALPHFQRAFDMKRALDAKEPIGAASMVRTLHQLGYMHLMRGDLDVASEIFHESHSLLEAEFESPHPKLATSFHWLADLYLKRGEPERALEFIDRATAERDGVDQSLEARSRVNENRLRARVLADLGRWDDVERELDRVAEIDFGGDLNRLERADAWTKARLHLARGETEQARQAVDRSFALDVGARKGSGAWAWAWTLRGRLRAALGEPGAIEDIDRALSVWRPRFTPKGPRAAELIALRARLTQD